MSDQARQGLDTGSAHVPGSTQPRSSITDGTADDQVDSHWARLFSGALLTSLFAMGVELSQGQNSSVLQSQSVGPQAGQLGVEVTRRNLNIQPTIKVRPGYRFLVRVEKDILFKGPYTPMRAGE